MLLTIANSINWGDCIYSGLYGLWVGMRIFFGAVFSSPFLTAFVVLGIIRTVLCRKHRHW